MFSTSNVTQSLVQDFRIDRMMRYSLFVPRLYNLCRALGFETGKIMPSRAFCSDENQGFPIILITKHFGAFPFNHGQVGGIVATDRHAPHADHGNDVVIIQASHVGYDPDTATFGSYCRLQTSDHRKTTTCGKIGNVIEWYQDEYRFAQDNIYLGRKGELHTLTIDNQLLDEQRAEGLFLDLDRMIAEEEGKRRLLHIMSTSQVFMAAEEFINLLPSSAWPAQGRAAVGAHLVPELFRFQRHIQGDVEGPNHLEKNLLHSMPWIVTSHYPLLVAALVNTQAEFDRVFRSLIKSHRYRNKRVLFISCLNIDISPQPGQMFPLTKCVPWAAYIQGMDGASRTLEQTELYELLLQQSADNPDQIDMEAAIAQMVHAPEIKIRLTE